MHQPISSGIFFCSFLELLTQQVSGYLPHYRSASIFNGFRLPVTPLKSQVSDDEDDMGLDIGPEKSHMTDYIAQYLGKSADDDQPQPEEVNDGVEGFDSDNLSSSTHLVAIPMDACHELLIELESVQRAILYHCPILLHSCIPAAMTRLPLLYVQAKEQNSARVTSFLADIVTELAQKHLFNSLEDVDDNEESTIGVEDLNEDGFRPFTMTFQSLEIDGSNNNILNTVGLSNDMGTKRLQAFVNDLKKKIESRGFKTAFPSDSHDAAKQTVGGFRPRLPFMELPRAFNDNLNKFKDKDTEISEEDAKFLTSENGGNGISPIFWCQWWDDTFARNCRLREVGIYPRTQEQAGDLSYSRFYLPHETISLPDGTTAMYTSEQKFEIYQNDRVQEEQREYEQLNSNNGSTAGTKQNAEPDILMTRTRERLEDIYEKSIEEINLKDSVGSTVEQGLDSLAIDDQSNEKSETAEILDGELDDDDLGLKPTTASPDDFIDDWMTSRIRKVVESRESVKSRKSVKKEKPPIEDNPVFKAYKEGTLVPKKQAREGKQRELGPYPGCDHFVGIWKIGTSPTGFVLEEASDEACENLVLRVDGTTAGGPILDPETKQKAAGGTWKFFEEENGDVRLRIRLVIPPKKERILVMEGIVNRMSINCDIPMASKTFGIPYLEKMATEANKSNMEDLMHCGGEVFMEDTVTKKNRENIGTFSLMKLQGLLEKGSYTITIPKPIRNQD